LLARISACAPIGIDGRQRLAQALVEQARALTPRHCAMSLALIYLVEQGASARSDERVRAFLRWGVSCDDPGAGARLLEARARRQVRRAYSCACLALGERYQLEPLTSAPLDDTLLALAAARSMVELRHAGWEGQSDWMVPIHAQPTLDLLLAQADMAAIQFTIELPPPQAGADEDADEGIVVSAEMVEDAEVDADAVETPTGRGRAFNVSVMALGAATAPAALGALAREMRGYGALALPAASRSKPPLARASRPQDDDDIVRMARNLIYPATRPANPADAVAYTMQEAAMMLPLQFKLLG
jgi:hypothetical protein